MTQTIRPPGLEKCNLSHTPNFCLAFLVSGDTETIVIPYPCTRRTPTFGTQKWKERKRLKHGWIRWINAKQPANNKGCCYSWLVSIAVIWVGESNLVFVFWVQFTQNQQQATRRTRDTERFLGVGERSLPSASFASQRQARRLVISRADILLCPCICDSVSS